MKRIITLILSIFLVIWIGSDAIGQVEVKGTGSTGSTFTFITKNSANDTSFVVKDNGFIGIDTQTPGYDVEVNGTLMVDTLRFLDGTIQITSGRYARVFTVATSGGDFPNLQAALANVILLIPSPTNQFLIQVMPGNYPQLSSLVQCQEYVNIRGSGKYSTTINDPFWGADTCVIEDLFMAQGITCIGTSPTMWHNIITNTTTDNSDGIYISNGGDPWIKENEIIDCNGWGINCVNFGSDPWIIANKILRNDYGGIGCEDSSPLISNNFIDHNHIFGIRLIGTVYPTEPTIDDNVIGHTDYEANGIGIMMTGLAEPRIFANDIYLNAIGIQIHPTGQPSILGNNINYNYRYGIETMSNGASKPVVIQGNHIHSSAVSAIPPSAGIWIAGFSVPVIAQNVIINNDPAGTNADIDYTANAPATPILNMNVYNIINRWFVPPPWLGTGQYNATSAGGIINP
jgi:hypothetical protein